jgi:hypothetical protein
MDDAFCDDCGIKFAPLDLRHRVPEGSVDLLVFTPTDGIQPKRVMTQPKTYCMACWKSK